MRASRVARLKHGSFPDCAWITTHKGVRRDSGSWRRLTTVTLQFGGRSAPFSRINVPNGMRESPMVTGEVLNIILAFAVRIVRGFPNNPSTASPSAVVVSVAFQGQNVLHATGQSPVNDRRQFDGIHSLTVRSPASASKALALTWRRVSQSVRTLSHSWMRKP
jgi:hypothetical protein